MSRALDQFARAFYPEPQLSQAATSVTSSVKHSAVCPNKSKAINGMLRSRGYSREVGGMVSVVTIPLRAPSVCW